MKTTIQTHTHIAPLFDDLMRFFPGDHFIVKRALYLEGQSAALASENKRLREALADCINALELKLGTRNTTLLNFARAALNESR